MLKKNLIVLLASFLALVSFQTAHAAKSIDDLTFQTVSDLKPYCHRETAEIWGCIDLSSNVVYLRDDLSEEELKETMAHEFGHYIMKDTLGLEKKLIALKSVIALEDAGLEIGDTKGIEDDDHGIEEFLADMFYLYLYQPYLFNAYIPDLADFYNDLLRS